MKYYKHDKVECVFPAGMKIATTWQSYKVQGTSIWDVNLGTQPEYYVLAIHEAEEKKDFMLTKSNSSWPGLAWPG